jgi:hypothetical protein
MKRFLGSRNGFESELGFEVEIRQEGNMRRCNLFSYCLGMHGGSIFYIFELF